MLTCFPETEKNYNAITLSSANLIMINDKPLANFDRSSQFKIAEIRVAKSLDYIFLLN